MFALNEIFDVDDEISVFEFMMNMNSNTHVDFVNLLNQFEIIQFHFYNILKFVDFENSINKKTIVEKKMNMKIEKSTIEFENMSHEMIFVRETFQTLKRFDFSKSNLIMHFLHSSSNDDNSIFESNSFFRL